MSVRFKCCVRAYTDIFDVTQKALLTCRTFFIGFLCMFAAGCVADDGFRRYAGAVGPELHSPATERNTPLLATYTSHLCLQAGLGDCSTRPLGTHELGALVQMGLYDIDQRCDTFLDSLYYKEKTRDPILAQISDVRSITRNVLEATKSTHAAIWIVALAFDLVERSYRNTSSALLDALDPTTVKTLVYGNQRKLKAEIAKARVGSLPEVYHLLRAYLRVCMPHAIEMEANAILTTGQRTSDGSGGTSPILLEAKTADSAATGPARPPRFESEVADENVVALFGPASGRVRAAVRDVQARLCAPVDGGVGAQTRTRVQLYRQVIDPAGWRANPDWRPLTADEARGILGIGSTCDARKFKNYHEARLLAQPTQLAAFTQRFATAAARFGAQELLDADELLSSNSSSFRSKVIALKTLGVYSSEQLEDGDAGHITPQFQQWLFEVTQNGQDQ